MSAPVRKVVFFFESPFTRRDYERFGMATLRDKGFAVEAWDLTAVLAPKSRLLVPVPDPIAWEGLRVFTDRREALDAVASLEPTTFVISEITYAPRSLAIFRLLGRRSIRHAVDLPALATDLSAKARWRKRTQSFEMGNIPHYLLRRIPEQWLVRPSALGLAWGARYTVRKPFVHGHGEVLWVHAYDYDNYLRERDQRRDLSEPIAVFLDQFTPFHTDFFYQGGAPPVTAEWYYPRLCAYFDAIEKDFGLRVVVAAHPRSDYEKRGDCFGGREVLRGRTCELVHRSRLVILMESTAIGYAVLFRKPLLFVGGPRIGAKIWPEPAIDWLAGYFGRREHDLDQPASFDVSAEMHVDEGLYARHQNDYIKKAGSEEAPFWDIVAKRLAQYG